jgi:hypothetical protein
LQQGIAKFFNSNFKEGQELFGKGAFMTNFLQIVRKRDNFTLRERITREGILKTFLARNQKN